MAQQNPQVYFEISIAGVKKEQRIVMELYQDTTPKTAENFRSLCVGDKKNKAGVALSYKGCKFHRIIPNFMCQGGDITRGDGAGGESIYGRKFPDESFSRKHTGLGVLSMANSGRNTNSSQFFICMVPTPWLDGKHVVFGKLISGFEVLKEIENAGSQSGKPRKTVLISDCGQTPPATHDEA